MISKHHIFKLLLVFAFESSLSGGWNQNCRVDLNDPRLDESGVLLNAKNKDCLISVEYITVYHLQLGKSIMK